MDPQPILDEINFHTQNKLCQVHTENIRMMRYSCQQEVTHLSWYEKKLLVKQGLVQIPAKYDGIVLESINGDKSVYEKHVNKVPNTLINVLEQLKFPKTVAKIVNLYSQSHRFKISGIVNGETIFTRLFYDDFPALVLGAQTILTKNGDIVFIKTMMNPNIEHPQLYINMKYVVLHPLIKKKTIDMHSISLERIK